MSYVADRNDSKEKWKEFRRASQELGGVLLNAKYNSTFTERQVLQCGYLDAQLRADRYKIWEEIYDVLEGVDETDN